MKNNLIFRLYKFLKPFTFFIIISIILAILISGLDLLNPYITSIVIDKYLMVKNSSYNIYTLGGAYFACVVLAALLSYLQVFILNYTGQKIMHNIRLETFKHLQFLPLSYFDKNSTGKILTKITTDIEALSEMFAGVVVGLVKDVILIIGIVIVMLKLNVTLALISFIIVPIVMVSTLIYNNKAVKNFRYVRTLTGIINGFIAENISGMRLVQIFNRQKEKFDEFNKLNKEFYKGSMRSVLLESINVPVTEFLNSLAISMILWFAIGKVNSGMLQIGILYAFISYMKKFFAPINHLADMYSTIQTGLVSADRIFELLDTVEGYENIEQGVSLEKISGKIEFKNVWFSYVENEWVLKDVSFTINPNETVAFVGHTGSGKSTIISLICKFYTIQKGEILIDGININDIKLSQLRKNIAIVMQEVFLFAGNIKNNVSLNNEDISENDVIKACEFVNADGFINKLPQKYNESVMERGATLSTGQRQLLSFARAIAFKPSIIILDEATSNIDTNTELIIQDSLKKVSKNQTTIVIAHRLSTIANADKILVIDNGMLVENGNHSELLLQNGFYKSLYDMQF